MKRPPYASKSIAALAQDMPAAGVWWVCAGAQAWDRARAWVDSTETPRLTACVPPDEDPGGYRWDFAAGRCLVLYVGVFNAESALAQQIAQVALAFGAVAVVAVFDDAPPVMHVGAWLTAAALDDYPQVYRLLQFCEQCGGIEH